MYSVYIHEYTYNKIKKLTNRVDNQIHLGRLI